MAKAKDRTSGVSAQQGAAENQQQPTGQTGHTPGPWYYNKNRRNIYTVAKDFVVAKVHCSEHDTYSEEDAERDANGKLMAAAPDLLAACEAALQLYDGMTASKNAATGVQLRAAIAKATGKAVGQ
jgi:hypothetical protein